ncbi:MAG: DUF3006 domain-containing protein [Clostridiaceae bacterium]
MKGIIDRFEGNYALVELETGSYIEIKIGRLPKEACEGDVIIISDEDILDEITLDEEESKKRREEIKEITRDFWKD